MEALGERRIFFFSPALISFRAAECSTSWRCGGGGRGEGRRGSNNIEKMKRVKLLELLLTERHSGVSEVWTAAVIHTITPSHCCSLTFFSLFPLPPSSGGEHVAAMASGDNQHLFFLVQFFFFFYNPSQWLNYCPCSGDDGDKQRARWRRAWNRSRVVLFESFILFFSRRVP